MKRHSPHIRLLAASSLIVSGALVLAGCGRTDSPETAQSAGAEIDDAPATGEINVWAFGAEGAALEKIAADFEADNPDADVVITPVPNDELPRKVDTALASGNVPDILQPSTALPTYVNTGGLATVPDGVFDEADFFPGAVEAGQIDGSQYAVPWYVNVQSLFYRTDMAEAAGIDAPSDWEDVPEFSDAMKGQGAEYGFFANSSPTNAWNPILSMIYQTGGSVVDGDDFALDSPEAVDALTAYQKLFSSGAIDLNFIPTQSGESEVALAEGRLGAFVSGSFSFNILDQSAEAGQVDLDHIGIAPIPGVDGESISYLGGSGLSVFEEAPNPDGAWKFVRYLSQPEVQAKFYEESGTLPAQVDAWDLEPFATDPLLSVFREALTTARATPAIPTWLEIRQVISETGEQLARQTLDPEAGAADMQSRAESIGVG